MPTIKVNGVSLSYEEYGQGAETILFVHGLLFNNHMFDPQIEAFKANYRCIGVDLRGQGKSEVTRSGYDIDNLTNDTLALIEALDCGPCHLVGLSMGGFIGMRLAINHPQVLRSLSLLETSADPEPKENLFKYRLMMYTGRIFGFRPLIGQLLPIMFASDTLADGEQAGMLEYWKQQLADNDKIGSSRAAKGVIGRDGVYQHLGKITTPTLIVVGDQDVATTPEKAKRMHEAIKGSQLVTIPGAGHSSSIEKPAEVTRALQAFITAPPYRS